MGMRFTTGAFRKHEERVEGLVNNLRESFEEGFEVIGVKGKAEMQGYIEDRGTAYSHYRANVLGRGTEGRHDTGEMVDAVDSDVSSTTNTVTLEVGWINEFRDYFQLQEDDPNGKIEPMFALRDTGTTVRAEARAAVPLLVKKAFGK